MIITNELSRATCQIKKTPNWRVLVIKRGPVVTRGQTEGEPSQEPQSRAGMANGESTNQPRTKSFMERTFGAYC